MEKILIIFFFRFPNFTILASIEFVIPIRKKLNWKAGIFTISFLDHFATIVTRLMNFSFPTQFFELAKLIQGLKIFKKSNKKMELLNTFELKMIVVEKPLPLYLFPEI